MSLREIFKFQFIERLRYEKLTEHCRAAPGGGPGEGGFEIGLPTLEKRERTERFHEAPPPGGFFAYFLAETRK